MSDNGMPPAVACYWHGAHYPAEVCTGPATATDFRTYADGMIGRLLAKQTAAVEQRLRDVLIARGVDPDDRTSGWEDRARTAMADLELEDSVEWSDPDRVTVTTEIRATPRR